MKNLINRALVAEKRLFFIFAAAMITVNTLAVEKSISPTACGITVGQTTKTGKTPAEWGDILNDYRLMNVLASDSSKEVYLGHFVVEGFRMPVLSMELINDTVYQLSFYENSPYADCWDSYKDLAFKLRDKYAHFENETEPVNNDSAVMFIKTDGKTEMSFAAYPHSISLTLTNVHFQHIWAKRLVDELNSALSEILGPNHDEKNKVTGVAGVNFGDSRESVRRTILTKSENIVESDSHHITFVKVKIGGLVFTYAEFYFIQGKGLVSVKLSNVFDSWQEEEAKMFYENVVANYKGKYSNLKENEEGDYAFCGAFTDDYNDLLPIVISRKKSLSRGGDIKYYVDVSYFIKRTYNMYDDDI